MKRLRALTLLTLLPSALAFGELKLNVERVEVKPKPEDEVVNVEFGFKNLGTKPVTIQSLESGCHCLSSSLDKRTYAAGEAGKGKAEFKIGSFTGQHEKIITVTTDDPAQPEWIIPFLVDIPEVVSIEPKNVQWWLNEDPSPKPITVKMTGTDPMKITNITSTREAVGFTWKEITPGREYTVTVTPKSTAEVIIGALKLETDSKIPKYARQLAFFSIVRQPESRKDEVHAGDKPKP